MKTFAFGSHHLESQYFTEGYRWGFTKSTRNRFNKTALENGTFILYAIGSHPIQKLLRENELAVPGLMSKFLVDAKDEQSAVWLKMCWEDVVAPNPATNKTLKLDAVYDFEIPAIKEKILQRKKLIAIKDHFSRLSNLTHVVSCVMDAGPQFGLNSDEEVEQALRVILDRLPVETSEANYTHTCKRIRKVEKEIIDLIQKMRHC